MKSCLLSHRSWSEKHRQADKHKCIYKHRTLGKRMQKWQFIFLTYRIKEKVKNCVCGKLNSWFSFHNNEIIKPDPIGIFVHKMKKVLCQLLNCKNTVSAPGDLCLFPYHFPRTWHCIAKYQMMPLLWNFLFYLKCLFEKMRISLYSLVSDTNVQFNDFYSKHCKVFNF